MIQQILEWLADQPDPEADEKSLLDALDGSDDSDHHRAVIKHHVDLCIQAGYVQVVTEKGRNRTLQLTWKGHQQLGGEASTVRVDS